MKRNYVPVSAQSKNKEELWRIDVTNLDITELVELREQLLKEPNKATIQVIDALIRQETDQLLTNSNGKNGYIRTYKKNKKEEKQRIRRKSRRK